MANDNLFNSLKKLFSTQVVVRRVGKGKIKVVDSSRLQSSGNKRGSSHFDRYGRLHNTNKNWQTYNERFNYHANKLELYSDYEAMDKDSILHSVLDIYSDEATLKNDMGDVLKIKSTDEDTKKILRNLFYDVLNIEFNLWSWVRGMNKYGDYYLELDIDPELGVVNAEPMSAYEVVREEGYDEENPYSVRFRMQSQHVNSYSRQPQGNDRYLESFQVAHFRLMSDTNFLPYGRSLLEGARKTWKQLTLMEDAMMIHRIMRAPEKRVFKIGIGNIPPEEVDNHMQNIIDGMKKVPYIDEATGDYNLQFNLQNMLEDYYLPVRGSESGTEIDTLSGMDFGGIDDIEYLRNRMMAALKVPKAFVGYDDSVNGKATLAQEDIRFARSVERVQKIVESELTKIAIVHLYSQGYENAELVNFKLELTTPSIVYEQEKLNLWSEKATFVRDMKELKMFSNEWLYENVFNMSEDEWKEEQHKVINDLKLGFRHEQIEQEGNDPVKTGESFGTPHDLATANQQPQENGGSPEGGFEGAGRPKEGGTFGKDKNAMGRDQIGKKEMKSNESKFDASVILSKDETKNIISKMPRKVKTKQMIIESLSVEQKAELDMMDEKNILDSDN